MDKAIRIRRMSRNLVLSILGIIIMLLGNYNVLAAPALDPNVVGSSPHYVIFISGWQCMDVAFGKHINSDPVDPIPGWAMYVQTLLGEGDIKNSIFLDDVMGLGLTEDRFLYFSYTGKWNDELKFQEPVYTYSDTQVHDEGPEGELCPESIFIEEEIELPLGRKIRYSRPDPRWLEKGDTELFEKRAGYINHMMNTILQDQPDAEFTIIGHSQGGVIAAYWAGSKTSQDLRNHVGAIVTLHSPLQGDMVKFVPFMPNPWHEDVRETVKVGPDNVPMYVILHKDDLAVPGSANILDGAWLELLYANRDPGESPIEIAWGDRTIKMIVNHGVALSQPAMARSVAVAMAAGAVGEPNAANPYLAGDHSAPYKWLNNAFTKGPIRIAVPGYMPTQHGTNRHSKLDISIDGKPVGKVLFVGLKDPNKEGKLGANDSLDGQNLEWQWTTVIKNPPAVSSPGTKDLQVKTQPVHIASEERQDKSVIYGGDVNLGADIIEVIDVSGSMQGVKLEQAKNAAKLLVDLTTDSDQIGTVKFSTAARTVFPLSPATTTNRESAKEEIDKLIEENLTAIGAGLEEALKQFSDRGLETNSDVIVLLSDGQETASPTWNDVQQDVIASGVKVYAVGLGMDADQGLLQEIASATGGQYYFSPTAQQLQQVYDSITADIQGRQTFQVSEGAVEPGESKVFSVDVDGSTTQLRFVLSWTNSYANLSLRLVNPSGDTINDQNYQNFQGVSFVSSDTYQVFTVDQPQTGRWQYVVDSHQVSAAEYRQGAFTTLQGDDFSVGVDGNSDLLMVRLTPDKDSFVAYEPVDLGVSLLDEAPLSDATVRAVIVRPDNTSEELELSEDGDGEYWGTFIPTLEGSYTVEITASGVASDGSLFERSQTLALFIVDNPLPPADLKVSVASVPESTAGGITEYCVAFGNEGPVSAPSAGLFALIENGYLESSDIVVPPDDADRNDLLWPLGVLAPQTGQIAKLRAGSISDTLPVISTMLWDGVTDNQIIDLTNAPTVDLNLENNDSSTRSETQVSLKDGWNLIHLPRRPTVKDPQAVFCPFSGVLDVVLGFDGSGLTYDPNLPEFSTLKEMNATSAYWIRVSGNALLNISGGELTSNEPIYLKEGWNLVGYLPDFEMDVDVALASIAGKYDIVLGYDDGGLSFYTEVPPHMNTLKVLEPGLGYWIHMREPGRLQYPFDDSLRTPQSTSLNRPQKAASSSATNEWINIYSRNSTYNGRSLPPRTVVTAIGEDGRTLGATVVQETGRFGVLTIYRDDTYTSELDGARAGEHIRFLIKGQPAVITNGAEPVWTSNGDLVEVDLSATGPDISHRYHLPLVSH